MSEVLEQLSTYGVEYRDEDLDPRYRMCINYYLQGWDKRKAAEKAGFSRMTAKDIFERRDVKNEIERRVKLSEYKSELNRDYLINKLRLIIEAEEPIEYDHKGRPSLNFNLVRPELKNLLGKITVTETTVKQKYGKPIREVKYTNIGVKEKIEAIKELGVLLGVREEKTKLDMEDTLIKALADRRTQLSNETDKENK